MNLDKIDCKSISYKIKSSDFSEDFFLFIPKQHGVVKVYQYLLKMH